MQPNHLPPLGARYWSALCLASIFGANMGDLFARNLGLGHVAGLPFLAAALAIVIVSRTLRPAATSKLLLARDHHRANGCDQLRGFCCRRFETAENLGNGRPGGSSRRRGLDELAILLAAACGQDRRHVRADFGYWVCMFIAGTLGTVIGDFCSHNMHLGDAGAALLLSPVVAILFLTGRRGLLLLLPFYWTTVVAIRAAGTAVGDLLAGRNLLGLPLSTAVTGVLFVALLVIWKQSARPERAVVVAP